MRFRLFPLIILSICSSPFPVVLSAAVSSEVEDGSVPSVVFPADTENAQRQRSCERQRARIEERHIFPSDTENAQRLCEKQREMLEARRRRRGSRKTSASVVESTTDSQVNSTSLQDVDLPKLAASEKQARRERIRGARDKAKRLATAALEAKKASEKRNFHIGLQMCLERVEKAKERRLSRNGSLRSDTSSPISSVSSADSNAPASGVLSFTGLRGMTGNALSQSTSSTSLALSDPDFDVPSIDDATVAMDPGGNTAANIEISSCSSNDGTPIRTVTPVSPVASNKSEHRSSVLLNSTSKNVLNPDTLSQKLEAIVAHASRAGISPPRSPQAGVSPPNLVKLAATQKTEEHSQAESEVEEVPHSPTTVVLSPTRVVSTPPAKQRPVHPTKMLKSLIDDTIEFTTKPSRIKEDREFENVKIKSILFAIRPAGTVSTYSTPDSMRKNHFVVGNSETLGKQLSVKVSQEIQNSFASKIMNLTQLKVLIGAKVNVKVYVGGCEEAQKQFGTIVKAWVNVEREHGGDSVIDLNKNIFLPHENAEKIQRKIQNYESIAGIQLPEYYDGAPIISNSYAVCEEARERQIQLELKRRERNWVPRFSAKTITSKKPGLKRSDSVAFVSGFQDQSIVMVDTAVDETKPMERVDTSRKGNGFLRGNGLRGSGIMPVVCSGICTDEEPSYRKNEKENIASIRPLRQNVPIISMPLPVLQRELDRTCSTNVSDGHTAQVENTSLSRELIRDCKDLNELLSEIKSNTNPIYDSAKEEAILFDRAELFAQNNDSLPQQKPQNCRSYAQHTPPASSTEFLDMAISMLAQTAKKILLGTSTPGGEKEVLGTTGMTNSELKTLLELIVRSASELDSQLAQQKSEIIDDTEFSNRFDILDGSVDSNTVTPVFIHSLHNKAQFDEAVRIAAELIGEIAEKVLLVLAAGGDKFG